MKSIKLIKPRESNKNFLNVIFHSVVYILREQRQHLFLFFLQLLLIYTKKGEKQRKDLCLDFVF